MSVLDSHSNLSARNAIFAAVVFIAAELLAIGYIYKHGIDFYCLDNWSRNTCASASYLLVSIYGVIGAFVLYGLLTKKAFSGLFDHAGAQYWPIGLNIVGLGIAMFPVLLLKEGSGASAVIPSFLCWFVGMGMMATGILLFLAPVWVWRDFLRRNGRRLIPLLAGGAVAPFIAIYIRPLWQLESIAGPTFSAVENMILLFGYDVQSNAEHKLIGANDFFISVAPMCSGVEGIALVSIFVTLYIWFP